MGYSKGRVKEIRLGASGHTEVFIVCPASIIPHPGQYLLVSDFADGQGILSTPVFLTEIANQGFWGCSLQPVFWVPATGLDLIGPYGHGFDFPGNIQRLGMVALGETVSRLLPLIQMVANTHTAMTLFTDLPIPKLPSALEVAPLASLPEALDWPDYLVVDVPLTELEHLRRVMGLSAGAVLTCPAQVLITSPIPCSGMGQCGACAVQSHRGWKLVCEDGPVFNLRDLNW